jgi:glutamate carboxypeptidase
MKSGVAFSIFAIRALVELDHPVSRRVFLQLNSDEEIGSPSSRALTEEIGRKSSAVLVLEFGHGTAGKLKTSRKGVAVYNVEVTGCNSHAGLDLEKGANAILELSKQITHVSGIGNPARGTTVNVGLISGGTRPNVVPREARMEVDVRFARMREVVAVEEKFAGLAPFDKRCKLQISGGVRRPPMMQSAASRALFRKARSLASEIGVPLEESATGGTSDGNFTAALGVPTLDGLGGVGEGAHALNESILENRIPDRVALLGGLIASL